MNALKKLCYYKILVIVFALLFFQTAFTFAQSIRVVATFPELADITRQIGKEMVNVESLARGVEDPHNVPVKPSFVPRLNRADALVVIGLENEHAWLPPLLDVASNPKILPGRQGYIDCSIGIPVLDVPARLDRSEGDVHPRGNPHYMMDPVYAKVAAENIAAGLSRNFPQHRDAFARNLKAYQAELDSWIARWNKSAADLRGLAYVEYHPEWVYFANRFGMERVGSVELKPGIEPSPTHLLELMQLIRQQKPQLLLYGAQSPRLPHRIAAETGIKILRLYSNAGGRPETDTYIKWIDFTVRALVQALSQVN
jgi:zinc/manganese transport system substrate-binding protein